MKSREQGLYILCYAHAEIVGQEVCDCTFRADFVSGGGISLDQYCADPKIVRNGSVIQTSGTRYLSILERYHGYSVF